MGKKLVDGIISSNVIAFQEAMQLVCFVTNIVDVL